MPAPHKNYNRIGALGTGTLYAAERSDNCGGTMKIVGFIEESPVIEKILRHCNLWKDPPMRAPPVVSHAPPVLAEPALDYGFFEQNRP